MRLALLLIAAAAAGFGQTPVMVPGLEPVRPAARGGQPPAGGRATQAPAKPPGAAASFARDLKFPPLHALQPPQPVTVTLPNGLRVYLVERHELPVLGGVVMVRTGAAFDPPDRVGLAALTGRLLRSGGTATISPEQVDLQLASLGMTLDSTAGSTAATLTFSTLRRTAEPSLALLREILEHPAFEHDRLELARQNMRGTIAHRNDDPAAVAGRELSRLILGRDTPYGWSMNYNGLERITGSDVRNFHRKYFFPANVMLGLWGDFDPQQMRTLVEKVFGDWSAPAQAVPAFPQAKGAPAPGIYLAQVKDPMVSYLAIGQPSGMVTGKDYPALEVMALLFNRIQARIRERGRGDFGAGRLSLIGVQLDDAQATWGAGMDHAGVFRITAKCRGAATTESVHAVLDDIDRIRTAPVDDEDLRAARDAALAGLLAGWDTSAEGVLRLMTLEYYGIPRDFVHRYEAGIQAVTKADVQRVARQYLDPANLTIVVVGNPQVFGTPLEKLNPQVNRIDLTIPEPKATVIEATDVSLAEGKRLLARAQDAVGGADKLAAVKDYVLQTEYQLDPTVASIGGSTVPQTDRWISPLVFRQDLALPTGRISAFSDGTSGWIVTPQGWGALVGAQLKQLQSDLFRSYFRFLLSDRVAGRTVNAVDRDLVEITDPSGQTARIEFDPNTGLPRRATYDTPQATGSPLFTEDRYSDFRDLGGIQFPFKTVILQAGRKFADVIVKDIKINTGLRQADLATRPQ
jgi:zinc protease